VARKTKAQLRKARKEETIQWISIVILSAFMIMGLTRSGVVGTFLYNLQRYLFGGLFWLILLLAVITIGMDLFNRHHGEEKKNPAPMILIACAILILCAWVSTDEPGFGAMMAFVNDLKSYFISDVTVDVGGGILGGLLYGASSYLFARNGTILVVVVLFVIAALLLVSLDVYKHAFASIAAFFKAPEKEEEIEEEEEKEPANLWKMLDAHKEKKQARMHAITADSPENEKTADLDLREHKDNGSVPPLDPDQPRMTKLINIRADGPTEEIPVVQIPGKVVSDEESPFINVDELIDHNEDQHEEEPEDLHIPEEPLQEEVPADEEATAELSVEAVQEAQTESKEAEGKPVSEEKAEPAAKQKKPSALKPYVKMSARLIHNLLDKRTRDDVDTENAAAAREKGQLLISILHNFDIEAELIDTHIGPAVTQFEIRPDANVKISKILGLADNIKMALAAKDVRIEAPIPGRNAVGVEIPNVKAKAVKMTELIGSKDISEKERKDPLLFYLGKDLLGRAVACRLDKMPHLLIAGATGSGKSVCMNSIITSILLRTDPSDVKMLLIDPKKVEFTPYKDIPHLIGPIINDPTEASNALKAIAAIMDERYNMFAAAGVRNIEVFNQKVKEQGGRPNPDGSPASKKLPYIVVVIDELADLMVVAGKEVESSIQRITQLARAAGIHLIVATQRPSVDVITGIIKANIPSRIAFAVSSGTDSRTILDHTGAERLLGNGDMLYMPIGASNAIRVQGVFVTDEEVRRITDEVKKRGIPMYDDKFVMLQAAKDGTSGMSLSEDPLFEEIRQYVIEAQKASTSLLQRRFGIGYNRAARMIDTLEENGIIGPAQGSRPREVFIKPDKKKNTTETGEVIDD
jgi:S-DNA-T family DNA segregation ATPase FtsK/SpoIIIE